MASSLPGTPTSLWIATTPQTSFSTLNQQEETHVVIVGGGIVGLTAATFLQEAGAKVIILEAGRIVEGVTGNTTAKVTSLHKLRYKQLIESFGEEKAHQYGGSNQWAIDHIEQWSQEKGISCDFIREKSYVYTSDPEEISTIKEEVAAAKRLGLPASFTANLDLPYKTEGAICFDHQARFHPRSYLLGLAYEFTKKGGKLFEKSRVMKVEEESGQVVVTTPTGTVKAKKAIIASHYPIYDKSLFFTRLVPYRSYVLAAEVEGRLPTGMYINASRPYRSIRRQPYQGKDILLFGGEDHKTGHESDTEQRYKALEEWATQHFRVKKFLFRWSTQDNATPDGLPFIGTATPTTNQIYLATGFDGWGMSNGTVAGKLLSDLAQEIDNPWADLYNPHRFKASGTKKLIKENLGSAKHFVAGRLKGDTKMEAIKKGQGKIIRHGRKQLAVHRDDAGKLHAVSPVCTHLGCIVNWNTAEKSWDCPCHGSRFDHTGMVLHGPAVKDLKPEKL